MFPGTVKNDSQVSVKDSCNQCCCFQWKRKPNNKDTQKKVENQTPAIQAKIDSPRKMQHQVTEIHLDLKSTEDVEFVRPDPELSDQKH